LTKLPPYLGELWRTLENFGELWRTLENFGELWRTLEHFGALWRTLNLKVTHESEKGKACIPV